MPDQGKRKHTLIEDHNSSKQMKSAKVQKSIHAFGSVGKRRAIDDNDKMQKQMQRRDLSPASPQPTTTKAQCKRKREASPDNEGEVIVTSSTSMPKRKSNNTPVVTPRNKRFKNIAPPTPTDTPTRTAVALFDRLKIDGNARAIPCALQNKADAYDTPPDTPVSEKNKLGFSLSEEVEYLQDMYSSFLASLSLYYSHNGGTSPVNITALLPMITKHWKIREVKLEDVRRISAISERHMQEFSVQDYGRAGICINRTRAAKCTTPQVSTFIDEAKLNADFRQSLLKSWTSWQASTPKENGHVTTFLTSLPLAEITVNDSVQKAAPLFARGQQRLADLKASKTTAKSNANSLSAQTTTPTPAQNTRNRGTALLDRILSKQSLASKLPAGPTQEQLERRSALHRIEEVTRVLSLLAGSKERCSFSMPAVIQHLQQSLRNPISRDEVQRCLDLMSREIVPGFVKLVLSGEVTGVVIAKGANVSLVDLRTRVEQACM